MNRRTTDIVDIRRTRQDMIKRPHLYIKDAGWDNDTIDRLLAEIDRLETRLKDYGVDKSPNEKLSKASKEWAEADKVILSQASEKLIRATIPLIEDNEDTPSKPLTKESLQQEQVRVGKESTEWTQVAVDKVKDTNSHNPEIERIRESYNEAVKSGPSYSIFHREDVAILLQEIDRLKGVANRFEKYCDDLHESEMKTLELAKRLNDMLEKRTKIVINLTNRDNKLQEELKKVRGELEGLEIEYRSYRNTVIGVWHDLHKLIPEEHAIAYSKQALPVSSQIKAYVSYLVIELKRHKEDSRELHDIRVKQFEEIKRLKEGKFTEEEFQNLCHNMTIDGYKLATEAMERFAKGCTEYQKKLFGCMENKDKPYPRCGVMGHDLECEECGERLYNRRVDEVCPHKQPKTTQVNIESKQPFNDDPS